LSGTATHFAGFRIGLFLAHFVSFFRIVAGVISSHPRSDVTKTATPPTGEPDPIRLNVVARSIIKAGVKQPSASTSHFSASGLVLFVARSAFSLRLFSCFFSHVSLNTMGSGSFAMK
jgi:hypothetical protein